MRQITPLGRQIALLLAVLLILEGGLYASGKLVSRSTPFIAPPTQIGDWKVSPGDPPPADNQRDYPRQISFEYHNGNQDPVHVDFAQIQTINGLRAPQKYIADSDGRISPLNMVTLKHDDKPAFSLSLVQGVEGDVIVVHWCQAPGGDPYPMARDKTGLALKALATRKPIYTCDAWIPLHPTTVGARARGLLQQFADALADAIKKGS